MANKIIILSRISTAPQSIESQTNDLIREAERLGYDKKYHIIIESVESAIKLSEEERIGLQKLKYYIETDKDVDCVICWEPSRLSRQQKTLYSIRDYLISKKIQLYILNPYMKLLTDDRTQMDTTANIVFSLFSTIAENEMMIKKERFMRAKNELTKQGKKSAGAVIFGYMKDKDKNCVLHPLHSKIITDLFTYYAENEDTSLFETYKYASTKWPEIFPITEYTKAQHKIRHFFDTEYYYKGNWCYPPIISEELWNKVHDKMSKARCKPRYNTKLNYLGRGKVRCKECGNIMTGVGGNVNAYCCCTDKLHSLQINIDIMDWIIWEEVRVAANIASSLDNSSKIIEIDTKITNKKTEYSQIESYINEKTTKLDKLVALYLDDKIDNNIYNRRYEELNKDINDKKKQLEIIQSQINELESVLSNNNITEIKPVLLDDITDFDIKLEYVRKYLKNVILSRQEDKSILIEFEWLMPLVLPRSKYEYHFKGGRKKVYRINEDGTKDCIR
jgi:DNA invertase Pin-like site-specific DNA recombinase